MRIENRILHLNRVKFLLLFCKGYPEDNYFELKEDIPMSSILNQFIEICFRHNFNFEGIERMKIIQAIKNGSPELNFDDYQLE
jgi:hypothetical protein